MRSRCAHVSTIYGVRGRAGNESPTALNPPWLGKGKPARQTAQVTVGDGLVGVTPGQVTPCRIGAADGRRYRARVCAQCQF
jgi:hypothetical protein